VSNKTIYGLPDGPKNLKPLFPMVKWEEVEDYYLELYDDNGTQLLTTPLNKIGCCNDEDKKARISFVNTLGTVDGISITKIEEEFETKSDAYEKPLRYPLEKPIGGNYRYNIKANSAYKGTTACYKEEDMAWIKELLHSPLAWLQWKGSEEQTDDHIPIVISDTKIIPRKVEERYVYEIQIEFKLSNERSVIRS